MDKSISQFREVYKVGGEEYIALACPNITNYKIKVKNIFNTLFSPGTFVNEIEALYEQDVQEDAEPNVTASLQESKAIFIFKNMKGEKGEKGDPFTYSDLTPEQIQELQKPAIDAANEASIQTTYAKEQGDYAKQQGDYAKEQGLLAETRGGVPEAPIDDKLYARKNNQWEEIENTTQVDYMSKTTQGGIIALNAKQAGRFSFACGDSANAPANQAFGYGYQTNANGQYSFAGGYKCNANGLASISIGYNCISTGTRGIAMGDGANAEEDNAIALGKATAKRDSVAIGYQTKALGLHSVAIGYYNTSNGDGATTLGLQNTADGGNSFCMGTNNSTAGDSAVSLGDGNKCTGFTSIAFNRSTECNGDNSITLGYRTLSNTFAGVAIGYINEADTEDKKHNYNVNNTAFCIGNGVLISANSLSRSNAFKVLFNGTVYSDNSTVLPNADYAEMFEWFDGNPNDEDRIGRFVSLNGNKIVFSSSNDTPIGVISGTPSIIGDAPMRWQGKYLNDEWGRPIYEDVTIRYTETEYTTDDNGELISNDVEKLRIDRVRKLNPDYDPNQEYIPRENRKEWDAVGLLGKLLVKQDGTLVAGSFCKPGTDGVATKSEVGYYVMEVKNNNQALILFK